MANRANQLVTLVSDSVLEVRGERVMLDSEVAEAFGTETKRINEAVSRNPAKFNDTHVFKLNGPEWESLRSQSATSKSKRGGARYAPHVYTMKGVARLATILDTDQALRATDMIIDTFVQVYEQLANGATEIAIRNPSNFETDDDDVKAMKKFRRNLFKALNGLLDTVVDPTSEQTLRDVSQKIGSLAFQNVQDRLKEQGLKNAKLEADTSLVLAETEKLLAEARKTNSEATIIDMDVIEKKIGIIRNMIELSKELEPVEFVRVLESLETPTPALLPAPKSKTKKTD
ncbi:MAG: hypothetical protein CMK09_02565 [Ponticaulis sp.]|nr:hypothetical protein [Ponticaulis sp.]|tara:strand:- start:39894 stop:40754 length:861 start_codon:yes stop_codon:yes gene_type:complete